MNDLISRQDAIDAVNNHFGFSVEEEYGSAVQEVLNALPSVQPRRGKWIEYDDGWANVYYECSVCKEPFVLIDGTPADNLYNFCPNCGCRMEEGDADDR